MRVAFETRAMHRAFRYWAFLAQVQSAPVQLMPFPSHMLLEPRSKQSAAPLQPQDVPVQAKLVCTPCAPVVATVPPTLVCPARSTTAPEETGAVVVAV